MTRTNPFDLLDLTPAQESAVRQERDWGHEIGLCPRPLDHVRAEQAVIDVCRSTPSREPRLRNWLDKPRFLWCASPMEAVLKINGLKGLREPPPADAWMSEVYAIPDDFVPAPPLGGTLAHIIRREAKSLDRARNAVLYYLRKSRERERWQRLFQPRRDVAQDLSLASVQAWTDAHLGYRPFAADPRWMHGPGHLIAAFYGRCAHHLGIELPDAAEEVLRSATEAGLSCGLWWPYENLCLLSERPVEVVTNDEGVVHSERGPAIRYRDRHRIWVLNGVYVPSWLVELPEERIDPLRLLEIRNRSVRREFVRKVGIDRVCYKLETRCVDREGNYELLLLDLGDRRQRPYLKMLNPSLGTWHVEGVSSVCTTVAEALAWRNGTSIPPAELT